MVAGTRCRYPRRMRAGARELVSSARCGRGLSAPRAAKPSAGGALRPGCARRGSAGAGAQHRAAGSVQPARGRARRAEGCRGTAVAQSPSPRVAFYVATPLPPASPGPCRWLRCSGVSGTRWGLESSRRKCLFIKTPSPFGKRRGGQTPIVPHSQRLTFGVHSWNFFFFHFIVVLPADAKWVQSASGGGSWVSWVPLSVFFLLPNHQSSSKPHYLWGS